MFHNFSHVRSDERHIMNIAQKATCVSLILSVMIGGAAVHAQVPPATTVPPAVLGQWVTRNHKGVFEITRCGDHLCGKLVGLNYSDDIPRDQTGRSECGLPMLRDFVPDPDQPDRWNGSILDPNTNHVYQARMWVNQSGQLKLRGYLGIPMFGQTQTWLPYRGHIGPNCKMST
ncbi:hypothetical protein CFR73_14245 [Novacetimonas maltaceti]|uniref:DUF2147 domain-containing protein n=2 Tax=Acetobacteraceae TaxID=433 RepID=A0A318QYF5_9PROT|nr:hypothetical protein CFR73_14245 [Novacetimonas maltaceti]PYD80339.1 hypothetical protein CFR80_13805 [Komagataeibacter oboediens]GBR32403.1 hypothetical protein AA11826_0923 [Komagataeibacter oboediens DSM 11826]